MQFRVSFTQPVRDLSAIEAALLAIDPAAAIDLVRAGTQLRVASTLDAMQLGRVLAGTGHAIALEQVVAVPSECCGGCGG
jgi:hypothetical protein